MQGASTGIVYGGLKYQARCIADVKADANSISFLAGTLSLKDENEVHLIRLSASGTELVCDGLFYHPTEIWDLSSCPFDHEIFSTVSSTGQKYEANIWHIPEQDGQSNASQLEQLLSLEAHTRKIKCVLWWPSGKHDKLISMDEENLLLWNIDCSNKTAKVQSQESVGIRHYLSGGAWDPHDQNSVCAISDSVVQCWDLRTMKKANSIEHAHVLDVDYNPKRQNIIVTVENESGICVWDLRMPKVPIKELPGHAHWTWTVKHNPEYEDLILSAGTDSTVKLWFTSISQTSEPTLEGLESPTSRKIEPLLNLYNDYEDSVYGIAWSSREPTLFASLSYDGRVVVESIKSYLPKKR
ncbi:Protein TSSC1 [Zostera marina]|uniref:Protein TSSC1 n=1 Tax=Zostera marina TaxID=29655 RepID=A0A0K9P8I7_ZOSMR|nr:Protein TSSC1 [Zostera marina]